MVTEAFLSKVMAKERMSVDEEGSSDSLDTVASSNTSLNHSNVSKDLFSQIV